MKSDAVAGSTESDPIARRWNLTPLPRVELTAVAGLVLWEQPRNVGRRDGSVLESPLREDRHLEAEDRANTTCDDLSLERVQSLVRATRQLGERDRLGDGNDGRECVGTEPLEAMLARTGVGPHARAAVAAGVRE